MDTVSIIANAFLAVALDGPGDVEAVSVVASGVESAGVKGEGVAGAAEAVAFAESVADGDSFDAAAEAPGKTADLWDGAGEAAAIEVLIGDGENGFAGTGAEGVDTVGVAGIEEIEALEIEPGVEVGGRIGVDIEDEADAATLMDEVEQFLREQGDGK